MSNDITRVLEAKLKGLDSEISSLERQITKLKDEQSMLANTINFYRGGVKTVAKPAIAAPATGGGKRGPKKGAKAAKAANAAVATAPKAADKKKPGRPKKAEAAAIAAPVAAVAAPVAAAAKVEAPVVKKKPGRQPGFKPTPKPKVEAAAVAKPVAKPVVEKAAKGAKAAKAAKSGGNILARTAPKSEAPVAVADKGAGKPAVVKKKEDKSVKVLKTPKAGTSKSSKGVSLTAKVLELFKGGALEPIDVANGVGVDASKFNSVRSTINILYGKGTLGRRAKEGKSNTFLYGFPKWFEERGLSFESGVKGPKKGKKS